MQTVLDTIDTIKRYSRTPNIVDLYTAPRIWIEQNLVNLGDVEDISHITDHIYISGISATTNLDILKARGITHILSLISSPLPHQFPDDFEYHQFNVYDHEDFDLLQMMPLIARYINNVILEGGTILVHCMVGASRSVSAVMAYMIFVKFQNMTVDELLAMIKQERSIANPNPGFMLQLYKYDYMINNRNNQ